jgi:hypothetical protein
MRTNRRPSRTFETLENRSLLAGNVVAAVDGGGNLTITGDAKSNTIYLAETAHGGWRIQGLDTKVNGHGKTFVTAPVTGNISVDMGSGNDQFFMQDGRVPGNLSVQMGNGKNSMTLWNLDIALLTFDSGDLNDHVWIEHVVAANSGSSINTQAGKDSVTIRDFRAPDMQISLGTGNDSLSIKSALLTGGASPQLDIDAGGDRDTVNLDKVTTDTVQIEMGAGDKDSLTISSSTFDVGDLLDSGGTRGNIGGNGNGGVSGQPISSLTIGPNFTHRSGNFTHNIV